MSNADERVQFNELEDWEKEFRNYKKDSISRKTVVKLNNRTAELDQVWNGIVERHEILDKLGGTKTSEYWSSDCFGKLGTLYKEFKARIVEDINRIQQADKNSSSMDEFMEHKKSLEFYVKRFSVWSLADKSPAEVTVAIARLEAEYDKLSASFKLLQADRSPTDLIVLRQVMDDCTDAYQNIVIKLELSVGESHNLNTSTQCTTPPFNSSSPGQLNKSPSATNLFPTGQLNQSSPAPALMTVPNLQFANLSVSDTKDVLERVLLKTFSSSSHHDTHLPKLTLPVFDGNQRNWVEFRDQFDSMVHNNDKTPPIRKLNYLKSQLTGKAAKVIAHLTVSEGNYDAAYNAIRNRYNNVNSMMDDAWSLLLNQPVVSQDKSEMITTLLDTTKEAVHLLSNLGETVNESLIVHVVAHRMPPETRSLWEQQRCQEDSDTTFAILQRFLEGRIRSLGIMPPSNRSYVSNPRTNSYSGTNPAPINCIACNRAHNLNNCHQFKSLSSRDKLKLIQTHQHCIKCLQPHGLMECPKNWACYQCQQSHHTALHEALSSVPSQGPSQTSSNSSSSVGDVLLATALIKAFRPDGSSCIMRVLIDQGSMSSYITESAVKLLNLKRTSNTMRVNGVGGIEGTVRGEVAVSFTSAIAQKTHKKTFKINPLIMKKVASDLPTISGESFPEFDGLELADRNYFTCGQIDLILGSDIFSEILMSGMRKGSLLAQRTELGWILSGSPHSQQNKTIHPHCYTAVCSNDELNEALTKFWTTEEKVIPTVSWSAEEEVCEKFYKSTTSRNVDGRYVCRLPLKEDFELGRSRKIAVANMLQLEKRFRGNPPLKDKYVACMEEYMAMGHMIPATYSEEDFNIEGTDLFNCYYIPHLAVFKESSSTTQTRVVYNGSSKSSNGKSLNDNLHVGPVLQGDVLEKIMRFRLHKYICVCDICKMYRQILIDQLDWDYQRIIWRPTEFEKLKEYWLTTVTFGESSAPFTAIRTLEQLATDSESTYPMAANCLRLNTYVDDTHCGADTIEEVIEGRKQLSACLLSAGMHLRKWASNEQSILTGLSQEDCEHKSMVKFMGLNWCATTDMMSYDECKLMCKEIMTRRELLSQVARVSDPPGWIQPVIVPAKLLMQSTWSRTKEWDIPLPHEFSTKWKLINESLSQIHNIQIPRWTYCSRGSTYELHGFADASAVAYGCVIYLRSKTNDVTHPPRIILAKSRVAAVNPPSIPRLELKGALLMATMMEKVKNTLDIPMRMFGWLDSKVALYWINDPAPEKWNVFVRNRVTAIHSADPETTWQYVNTKENPADLVSRGCTYDTLMESKLWFEGPGWLRNWTETPPTPVPMSAADELGVDLERTKTTVSFVSAKINRDDDPLHKLILSCSDYRKLQKVTAYVLRFIQSAKRRTIPSEITITAKEICAAEEVLVKYVQESAYEEELCRITALDNLPIKSTLCGLNPFIDGKGVVRVGGRIQKAHVPFNQKHPIILPADHHFTELIIADRHEMVLHGGVQTTLNQIRKKFWIVNGLQVAKQYTKKCVRCQKCRAHINNQLMGILPSPRVNMTKAFLNCSVDFAGPFMIRSRAGRGIRPTKGYIAVFVCLATKAIHLEVVGSLTTHDFLSALRRFVARRGLVETMHSDNGTNFVCAARIMKELAGHLGARGIEWSFIPAQAPHFGGLWEAGVKSVKTHLRKVAGGQSFTYEEFSTILCQIEGCLNSRPLCPLSNDIDDLDALTPQHFLTGMMYVPVVDEDCEIKGSLRRWQLCQAIYQDVCRRYTREYLHRLQHRPKWMRTAGNVEVGQLVLLMDDNQPIASWPMGRVVKVHPGPDGLVRVATVRTKTGELSRPIRKLSLLPVIHKD